MTYFFHSVSTTTSASNLIQSDQLVRGSAATLPDGSGGSSAIVSSQAGGGGSSSTGSGVRKRKKRYRPSPIALEPCDGSRAAVLSLIVRLPTGGKPYAPPGYTGIAVASSLVTLGK